MKMSWWCWDVAFRFLLWLAPKLFKGTSGAEAHGRKTREKWLYPHWKGLRDAAVASTVDGQLGDCGAAWAKGCFRFDIDELIEKSDAGRTTHPVH